MDQDPIEQYLKKSTRIKAPPLTANNSSLENSRSEIRVPYTSVQTKPESILKSIRKSNLEFVKMSKG